MPLLAPSRSWPALVVLLFAGSVPADAGPDPLELSGSTSTSIGSPAHGRLEGGVPLPLSGPGFRFNPRRDRQARFGTVETVSALMQAAARVHEELPGGELTVNDLSFEKGGPISQHGSHRSGRDADVLFYLLGPDGSPIPSVGAPLDPEGRGVDFRDLADPDDDVPVRIDVPRTWRFLQALLENPDAHLQRIFVVEHLRSILLAHARKVDAPRGAVRRFAHLTCQPSYPHDDHFHFRFYCTAEDIGAGCEDSLPWYPWHRRHLREAGVTPVRARPRPRARAPKPDVTTHEEAREEAGPMHDDVVAWLERRKAWLRKPHPGRPYCR
ncbi:MAG: penicillin-insensitive murein endopeptidase [Myxococcota bacterium]